MHVGIMMRAPPPLHGLTLAFVAATTYITMHDAHAYTYASIMRLLRAVHRAAVMAQRVMISQPRRQALRALRVCRRNRGALAGDGGVPSLPCAGM